MNNSNIVPCASSYVCSFICALDASMINQIVGVICSGITTLMAVIWILFKMYMAAKDGQITDEEKKDIEKDLDDLKDLTDNQKDQEDKK